MINARKNDDMIYCVGPVIGPLEVCGGNVEIWDQTVGCPECGQELWTGKTDEAEFDARHPFVFDACHDDGDGEYDFEWARHLPPLGGWRFQWYTPMWHPDASGLPRHMKFPAFDRTPTQHEPLVTDRAGHDGGDEDDDAWRNPIF